MRIASLVVSTLVMGICLRATAVIGRKAILKLEDDWVRALKTKDRQIMDAIVAPNFTFIEPDGTVKIGMNISRTGPVTLLISNRSSRRS
jgi:hypothetical protein